MDGEYEYEKDYTPASELFWEDSSFVYLKKLGPKTVEICANAAGLRSLAAQLNQLADSEMFSIFYDTDLGDLEEGSLWLQILKVNVQGRSYPEEKEHGHTILTEKATNDGSCVKYPVQKGYTLQDFQSILIGKSSFKDVCEVVPTAKIAATSYGGICRLPALSGGNIQIKCYGKDLIVGCIEKQQSPQVENPI